MRRKAFVTGGTGFIGINLLKLLINKGWDVTALHRATSDLSEISRLPLNLTEGSVTDPESLHDAIPENTEVVFHLAGDTNMWSKRNDYQYQVNVAGTKNMVIAAAEKNVKTFIHTSSVAAWGTMEGRQVSEQTPQKGKDSWVNYEFTKWAGEQEALKGMHRGMDVVILNPAAVTGPHDKNNWGRLFIALKEKKLPAISDGCLSIAHVEQVVKAHLKAVDRGRKGEHYILAGVNCKITELIDTIIDVSEISNSPKRIPRSLFKLYANTLDIISTFTNTEPNLTPELAKIMSRRNLSFSSQKAIDELDYKIPPLETSVKDCYQWLKKEQLI